LINLLLHEAGKSSTDIIRKFHQGSTIRCEQQQRVASQAGIDYKKIRNDLKFCDDPKARAGLVHDLQVLDKKKGQRPMFGAYADEAKRTNKVEDKKEKKRKAEEQLGKHKADLQAAGWKYSGTQKVHHNAHQITHSIHSPLIHLVCLHSPIHSICCMQVIAERWARLQAKGPLANDLPKKKRGQSGSDTESEVDVPLAKLAKKRLSPNKFSFGSSNSNSDEEQEEEEEELQKKPALEEEEDDDDDADIRTIKRDHWVVDYGALESKHIYEVQYVSGEFPLRFDHLLCAL
jgi:hypothetical protein